MQAKPEVFIDGFCHSPPLTLRPTHNRKLPNDGAKLFFPNSIARPHLIEDGIDAQSGSLSVIIKRDKVMDDRARIDVPPHEPVPTARQEFQP